MGVLTDFVVADPGEAQRVCDSACPSQDFKGMDAKGIDPMKLGTLYAVLTGKDLDASFISGNPLSSRGERWVMQVPVDLVQRLAKLDAKQLQAAAACWAETEEFSPKYDNWPPQAVHQVLEELAQLCLRAVAERKGVLMWMSL
jgi:hypothetical protein